MDNIKQSLLKYMLPLVPFDGWSEHTMHEAADLAGVSKAELKQAFPEGVKDCVSFFLSEEDKILEELLPPEKLADRRVPEKIEKIIMTQLNTWLPKREIIRRTVSFNSLPWNSVWSLQTLYKSVDNMWRMAGDTTTDFRFYTKRMTLAGVYSTTLLVWLDDTSPGLETTFKFLHRQLSHVAVFGHFKKQLAECVESVIG